MRWKAGLFTAALILLTGIAFVIYRWGTAVHEIASVVPPAIQLTTPAPTVPWAGMPTQQDEPRAEIVGPPAAGMAADAAVSLSETAGHGGGLRTPAAPAASD